jgi:hypothetical protein
MVRSAVLALLGLVSTLVSAQTIDRARIYAGGGKSFTNWHGQADLQMINFEIGHALSPRTEVAFVFAPLRLYQPRSWFGNQFGDGGENVSAISGSLLVRRSFNLNSDRMQWFMEGSSGPMWADKRVPAATSRFNFISQAGAGVVLNPRSRVPFIVGYRFAHISNGGYAPRNPGLNVSTLVVGLQLRR